ncbi:hypothetical protein [Candidatus Borrarchaeum sp.]|uniref:hypothetical protein n=1 Tax=Candidatus Borrarchaeum sp. TaxID=2846742 RepID=UPI00257CEB2D|nr:hypothetical protein [Candidatus Borrarchaeum sp.]
MNYTFHVTTRRRDLTALQEMLSVFQQNDVNLERMELSAHPDSSTVTFSFSTEEEKVNSLKSVLSTFGRVDELTSEKLLLLLS